MPNSPMTSDDYASWKSHVTSASEFLLAHYASQMVIFTPTDPIHHAMANHVSALENLLDALDGTAFPEVLLPRESELNGQAHFALDGHLETLTVITHGCATFPAALAAMAGMEKFLRSMMSETRRTGKFAFITSGRLADANRHWMTLRRDPDYHIGGSENGRHSLHFSGTEAFVCGGYLGHCHLLATEDLVNHHQGDALTVHWPMQTIYALKESIEAVWLRGLTLDDIFLHYQTDASRFLDRIESHLHGDNRLGLSHPPSRILARDATPFRIDIQINGVSQRTYGAPAGKPVRINLVQ